MNTSTASTGLRGLIATAIFGALALSFTAVSAADPSSASVNVNYKEKVPAPETRAVRVPLADLVSQRRKVGARYANACTKQPDAYAPSSSTFKISRTSRTL